MGGLLSFACLTFFSHACGPLLDSSSELRTWAPVEPVKSPGTVLDWAHASTCWNKTCPSPSRHNNPERDVIRQVCWIYNTQWIWCFSYQYIWMICIFAGIRWCTGIPGIYEGADSGFTEQSSCIPKLNNNRITFYRLDSGFTKLRRLIYSKEHTVSSLNFRIAISNLFTWHICSCNRRWRGLLDTRTRLVLGKGGSRARKGAYSANACGKIEIFSYITKLNIFLHK